MPEETELSDREREILRLVATGASNKEIAHALVISPNTVKVHLRNIFAKVGVASRTEATLYAIRMGLLPPPTLETIPNLPAEEETRAESPEIPPVPAQSGEPESNPAAAKPARRPLFYLALTAIVLLLVGSFGSYAWMQSRPTPTSPPPLPTSTVPPRWSHKAPLPEAVRDPAGTVYEGSIYVIGGEISSGVTGKTWRYDSRTDRWQPAAAKPTPVSGASAVLLGERIFVPGGRLSGGKPTNKLEVYDPRSDRWETRAPLPQALSGYALAAVEGEMYLFGGWDGAKAVESVYRYDPTADRWYPCRSLPTPRAYSGAAEVEGHVLLAGGFDGQAAQASTWLYYPTRDQDGENPWEIRASLPEPREAFGMTTLAGRVYLTGGEGAASLAPLEYLPQENRWQAFEQPPVSTGSHGLLLPLDTHLHALGGSITDHQIYQAIYNILFPVIQ